MAAVTQEQGIPYQRHRPSAALREFLEPLDRGPYFDCGRARLHGLDDALVREAKSRGREPGEDSFQLVATETGLVFCRESIAFAIAAPWERITVGRPSGDDPVELAVIWPVHGELVFTVSRRLAGNVLRRWVQRRAKAAAGVGTPWTSSARSAPAPKAPGSTLRASAGVFIGSTDRPPAPAARTDRPSSEADAAPVGHEPIDTARIGPAGVPATSGGAGSDRGSVADVQPVDTMPIDRLPIAEVLDRLTAGGDDSPAGEPVRKRDRSPEKTDGRPQVSLDRARPVPAPSPPPIRPASSSRRVTPVATAAGPLQPDQVDQRISLPSSETNESKRRSPTSAGGAASLLGAMIAASAIVFALVTAISGYRSDRDDDRGEVAVDTVGETGGESAGDDPAPAGPTGTTIGHRRFGDGVDRPPSSSIPDASPSVADNVESDPEGRVGADLDLDSDLDSDLDPAVEPGGRSGDDRDRSGAEIIARPVPTGPVRCNSNYSGCVPDVDDVDCPGGDGPVFAPEPGVVMGEDVYGLDTDGDGRTCEADQPV